MLSRCGREIGGIECGRAERVPVCSGAEPRFFPGSVSGNFRKIRHFAMMLLALSIAFLFHPYQALASTTYDQCIYALDQTAANALYIDGAVILNAPSCGVVVDSSSSTALKFSGSGSFTAKYFDVVGGYSTSGSVTFSPTPTTGSAYQGDPLTFLVPPTSTACTYTNFKVTTGSSTLTPGTYCNGITISGATNVTFNPGTYILMGGGLNVTGSSILKGSGVTFFVTQGLGYSYGPVSISSSVVATLSAPTSGSYYGILFYQDRGIGTGKAANTVTGASSSSLNGVLYFPTTALAFVGAVAGGNCLILVADTITLTGAAAIGNSCSGGSPLQPPVAVSVTPATATLYGGQTQQFTATVTNTTNTAVTWTISPTGTGTISSSGLYTAPATISTQQTVTVKATSQANTAVSASSTVTLMPKTTPTITWATPAPITYGTALSATQLDATASVAGTFAYTPAAGTVLAAGTQTLSVTFTPTNTTNYNTATASVSLTVNKATPVITWAPPAPITYGTVLSATQLDAMANVAGTFVYTPAAGTVLAAGSQTLSVTFTPTNTTDYSTTIFTVTLTVNEAAPAITWATPAAITYGTALSATQLDATASVAGTFVYTPAAGTVLAAGPQTLSVTFTPTNTTDYSTTTASVLLIVNKVTSVITWAAPAAITYGTALSATQLDATASVAGTFAYTPAAGTMLAAGSQTLSVTFTPTNTTDYSTATASVTLTVSQAVPTITWAAPAAITYGTALSATQLDATANVAGTFVYTPAAGTIPAAGSQTLSVTFTPTDTTDYSTATTAVSLTVNKVTPVITWAPPVAITYGTALSTTQLDATSSVAGTLVYTPAAGTVLATGSQTLSVTFTPTNTTDYNTATSSVTLTVQPLVPPIIVATPSPAPNAAGWNNSNVTVTFACTAGSYPINTCPAPVVVSTQVANQVITGTATDTNGNTASASVTVNLDTTPPTISASVSPTPNGAGWNTTTPVTVTFTCADTLSGVASCPAAQSITTAGANQIVKGTATDVAGNTASTQVTVNISKTPPTITPLIAPQPNSAGWNNSSVTVSFTCTPGGAPIATCPSPTVVTSQGSNIPVIGTVTDAAGATATATVVIKLDSTPPTIIPNLSPAPNSSGWETSPVTVSFTCSDSLSGVATCPSSTVISTNGANQTVSGTATDVAGNTATATANVNLEQSGPTITASVSPTANSAGWNDSNVIVTFTCNPSVSPIASCSPSQTVSSQGVGQVVTGTVQDQAGNQAATSVTLNIDKTPPAILQFTAPSQLSPGQSGSATITVTDIAPIASVVFELNGTEVGTALAPPFTVSVTAPTTATSGSTLTLTAVVTDIAGNVASANAGIQIASAGVIVGEVLSDATGLPLAGANLQVIGQTGQSTTSNSQGQYSIPVTSSQLFLSVSQPGNSNGTPAMVTVERQVAVQSGVGTVPVDARMTALATPVVITASGGTVGTGAITLMVPAGGATTSYILTPLSQQGLPGLLPLGWSPVVAFDLQANPSNGTSLSANFTGLPAGALYLVSYSYNVHAWSMVTPNLSASSGALTVPVPSTGDYALVVPDASNTSIQIPAVGQPLTGVPMVTLPTNASSIGSLSPSNIAPTGGTSTASLAVVSGTTVPSGTVIQSQVTETYTLTSGQALSEEPRYEDILLYQSPTPSGGAQVGAAFPVTPSQTFQVSQLTSGDVHLNILSGRESVRGATGGSDPVSVQSGGATLTVAGGSLSQDTAIAVSSEPVNTFLPSTSTLVPLSEYNVDFSGQVLSNAAQLSVGAGSAVPGSNVVIAQIQRVAGVPYLVVVSMAQVTATNIVSQATPGLPGIIQGGDYVFYEVTVPTGFVSGTVSAGSGPVAAMVQTDALPFVAFSNANGNYMIVAAAGTVHLTASVPNTALAGTATAQVTAGQTATANLSVAGQVEAATITPANGAVGVPLTAEIDITAAEGFNQATVTSSSVVLTAAGSSTPIALRFVFSGAGTTLAVFPQAALQPSTQYTLQASGLANAVGGLISVPAISFTTVAITPPTYNTNALVFAMPDSNGNVAISAPAGSFPPGSTFLIVDQTNGVVYSLTVLNDGSVTGQMPATINDVMQVTLTDPAGNVTTFTISQFVAADGTTAVGPGGGTVVGPGGTGIIIPAGALLQGVTFKLTQLDQTAFPTLPTWQGANFGSGMRITDPAMPTFKKEAKLAFPVPANAPSNAFYYVYRRLTDQNGNTYFETIDEAFVQGTGANAQVVTASPPFCGYHNSYGNFTTQTSSPPLPVTAINQDYFVMWDVTQGAPSGIASQGLIVGLAQQVVPAVVGVSPATTAPATGTVTITLSSNAANPTASQVAIYDGTCATFTLFDPQLGGGARSVTASNGTTTLQATAYEVDGAQSDDGLYAIYAGLEDLYKNIGRVSFMFPAPTPPPPPQQVSIQLFTLNSNGHRVPAGGILQTGTNLVIAFQSTLSVQSASIGTTQLDIETPDSTDGEVTDGLPEQYLLSARVKGLYPLGGPGTYVITVTALDPISLTQVTASQSILVVAAGGGNTSTITCTAAAPPPASPTAGCTVPQVVSVSPLNNASSVSTSVLPVVTFNEPVTNISSSNVVLACAAQTGANASSNCSAGSVVPVLLVGVRAPSSPNYSQNPIADPVQPTDVITSLTISPLAGLQYNQTYSLTLNANSSGACVGNGNPIAQPTNTTFIVDQNQPPSGPLCLQPYPAPGNPPYQFTTFGPQDLGGVASQYEVLTRPVVIGNTAYAGEYLSSALSGLGMFNITNPANPVDLGPGADFIGRAIDITGQAQSPVTGAGLVAISAGTAVDNEIPGNIWLYDVSSPTQPNRVGAVSVSSDVTSGIATRVFMKDQYLYASTFLQGLQVIDLGQAIAEYQQVFSTNPSQFGQAVSTAGDGFAMDAIVNTIPLPLNTGGGGQATMLDLKADNFSTSGGGTQTLVVAAGELPFVMADPTLSGSSAVLYPPNVGGNYSINPVQPLIMPSTDGTTNSLLCYGQALDIGTVAVTASNGTSTSQHIVVVVGNGFVGPASTTTSCPQTGQEPVLAVVNVSQTYTSGSPLTPQLIGFLPLPTGATDVTLSGTTALVSTGGNILLVNLESPSQPALAGTITGNFGNWLTVNSAGWIVGSSNSGPSGVQTSTLGPYIVLQQVVPAIINVDDSGNTTEPIQLTLSAQGQPGDLANASVTYSEDGTAKATIPIGNLQPGMQTVTIPAGLHTTSSFELVSLSLTAPDGTQTPSVVLSLNGPTFVPPTASSSTPPPTVYPVYPALPTPFDSVSPSSIQLGSGDTQVTAFGVATVGLTQVFIRDLDLNWNPIAASTTGPTSVQFVVPASLLAQAGFLEVAPTEDDSASIPLLVYNPSLPALGSLAGVELDYVTADDLDTVTADTVTVNGLDFPAGAAVVLGRGSQPGYVLATSQVGPGTLQAQIPVPFAIQANDLFVAVLSADGSELSAPLPLPAASLCTPASPGYEGDPDQPIATINPGVDPNEAMSTAQFGSADVGITSVSGNLIATLGDNIPHPPQTLTINGVNLADGLLVTFTTTKGGQLVQATAPLSGTQTLATLPTPDGSAPSNPTALMSSTVVVPPQILDPPLQNLHPSTPKAPGTSAPVTSKQPPVVPFGGRRQFGVYQGPNKEYRILPTSQAPANYTAATNATISIANAAANPTTNFNEIQLERESGDPSNTARIRGTGLFQLPCADIKRVKGVSASLPCSSTPRAAAQIQATQNGQVVATLNLESQYESLGGSANQFDPVIALFADQYGIPPHFIKSQAATESQTYTLNFRHEFTSIDLRRLSQDGPDAFVAGGQRRFATEPWSHYVYGGQGVLALGGYTSQAVQNSAQETQTFPYNSADPANTTFELGIAVKRTAGTVWGNLEPANGTEGGAMVFASIQTLAGQPIGAPLTLMHLDTVWQKAGCLKCPDSLSTGVALQNLQSTQFAVNYGTGVVTLGAPLQPNQQLVVRYWPVGIGYTDLLQQTVTTVPTAGNFVQNAPDLNTLTTLKPLQKLTYASNRAIQTLSAFLTANLQNGKKKGFLTTPNTNDRDVEFTVDQNNNPLSPRDPRYQFVMTQPYASSSYGFLQFTLLPFDPSTTNGQQLTAAFNPSQTALYQLVTQLETNFSLAAIYHSQSFNTLLSRPKTTFVPCGPTNCNEAKWEAEWISVFKLYNGSPAYANGTIVKEGAQNYTPVAPQ